MDLSGVEAATLNCLQYHSQNIVSTVSDERDFLRLWRRRWRDALADENARLFRFLRSHNEISDAEFLTHLKEIPPNSEWFRRHVDVVFDLNGLMSELETRFGVPYTTLREAQHAAHDLYAVVLRKLFDLEDVLNKKLEDIKSVSTSLESLTIIDLSGGEAAMLQSAIVNYIRGVYRSSQIDIVYKEFINTYGEWQALRGLVLGGHVARSETSVGPLCSICTTERLTYALNPCGHTFCNNCAQRQHSMCYICRSPVSSRLRLYFV
jgi:hypothetical protein